MNNANSQDDLVNEQNSSESVDVFSRAPEIEEADSRIASQPWILQKRLTFDAYATRCRLAGTEPHRDEWLQHLRLAPEELAQLDDLIEARREAFVEELSHAFVIRNYGGKARVGYFDNRGELETMSFDEFKRAYFERHIETAHDGKIKKVPLVEYWLRHPLTRRFDQVDYRLGVDQSDMPPDILNLWRGWPIGLSPGWDDHKLGPDGPEPNTNSIFDREKMPALYCDRFLEHMRQNMCGGDDAIFKYLLGWIADSILNPGPCETAVVLTGPQGSGKTMWVECVMEFFGVHAITLDDPEQLVGNFNRHLQNKSLVFADEAFFAGNRKHAAKIKTLITRPDIFIEPKGVDGFVAPKRFRLVFASNDEHVMQAERDDRRNLVLTVDAGQHNQDREYFAAIRKEWKEGGRSAFFRWLTGTYWRNEVGNQKFRMWKRPVTSALQLQKDLSLPRPLMAVFNILRDADIPGLHRFNEREGTVFVSTLALMQASQLGQEHQRSVGEALKVLAGANAKSEREYLGEGIARRQYRGFWLPSLEVCRTRWEKFLGRSVEWPEGISTWTDGGVMGGSDDAPF